MRRRGVLELVGHDVVEAALHLLGDVGALGQQPARLDHQVAARRGCPPRAGSDRGGHRARRTPSRAAPAPAERGVLASRSRAAAQSRSRSGVTRSSLQQVDPAQEPCQEPGRVAADLVAAQRQVVDAIEQDRQAVGRGDGREERVEPRLDRMLAQDPLGDLVVGADPELLVRVPRARSRSRSRNRAAPARVRASARIRSAAGTPSSTIAPNRRTSASVRPLPARPMTRREPLRWATATLLPIPTPARVCVLHPPQR